jgi:hypothetical protein
MMAWRSLCSLLECGGNDYAHLLCSKMHFPSFKRSWCMCVCVIIYFVASEGRQASVFPVLLYLSSSRYQLFLKNLYY